MGHNIFESFALPPTETELLALMTRLVFQSPSTLTNWYTSQRTVRETPSRHLHLLGIEPFCELDITIMDQDDTVGSEIFLDASASLANTTNCDTPASFSFNNGKYLAEPNTSITALYLQAFQSAEDLILAGYGAMPLGCGQCQG